MSNFRMDIASLRLFEPDRWSRFMYPRTLTFLLVLSGCLILLSILVRVRATYWLDLRATLALQRWSHPLADKVMRRLTWLGNTSTVTPIAIGCAIVAAIAKDLRAVLFILASLLAYPINVLLKGMFSRERPGEKEVRVHAGPRWGHSYPSGHAMGATAFYGLIAMLINLHLMDSATRSWLLVPFLLLPPLIGLSRMYVGAHWFSDVIGGMAAGSILIAFLAVLYPV